MPSAVASGAAHPGTEVVRLVQFNCQRLFPQQALLVEHFEDMLRLLVPEVRRLPEREEHHIAQQIVHTVLWTALTQDSTAEIERALDWLGRDNHARGFPRDGYLGVGHALLRSARTVTDQGWSSELSSAWVAYYSWIAERLTAGATGAQASGGPQPGVTPAGNQSHTASLDDVLPTLRRRHFPTDPRGLDAICTRVMLRTGADLRALRPDQRTDPAVVAEVLAVLAIMGFSSAPLTVPGALDRPVASADADRSIEPPDRDSRSAAPPEDRGRSRRPRWLRRILRRESR